MGTGHLRYQLFAFRALPYLVPHLETQDAGAHREADGHGLQDRPRRYWGWYVSFETAARTLDPHPLIGTATTWNHPLKNKLEAFWAWLVSDLKDFRMFEYWISFFVDVVVVYILMFLNYTIFKITNHNAIYLTWSRSQNLTSVHASRYDLQVILYKFPSRPDIRVMGIYKYPLQSFLTRLDHQLIFMIERDAAAATHDSKRSDISSSSEADSRIWIARRCYGEHRNVVSLAPLTWQLIGWMILYRGLLRNRITEAALELQPPAQTLLLRDFTKLLFSDHGSQFHRVIAPNLCLLHKLELTL